MMPLITFGFTKKKWLNVIYNLLLWVGICFIIAGIIWLIMEYFLYAVVFIAMLVGIKKFV